jgi:putative FmdB family regulatory protein
MPIYEFYCAACHVVFSFYAKSAGVKKQPKCPRCKEELRRQVSLFRMGGSTRGAEDLPLASRKVEQGLKKLDQLGERDPGEAARLRKKFSQFTGVSFEKDKKKPSAVMEPGPKAGRPQKESIKKSLPKPTTPPEQDSHLYEL